MSTRSSDFTLFAPSELAVLLGLDPADGLYFGAAQVRLPSAWVAEWRGRTGAMELTITEAAMVLGVGREVVWRWTTRATPPVLRRRNVAAYSYRVAPAELVRFLREINAGNRPPGVVETPGQQRRRAARAKERAAAACRGN